MKKFNEKEILGLEKSYRIKLINSITGFKSANLIGTSNKEGQSNLAIFSSVTHLGSSPPLVAMFSRPHTVARHTLKNIQETGLYTINHINESMAKKAHLTSARWPIEVSEFGACGLTEDYEESFSAPYVKESLIKLGVELKEIHDLSINQTVLIIGQIVEIICPETSLMTDGFCDLEQCQTLTISSCDSYHKTERLFRLSYAKTNKKLREVPLEGDLEEN